MSGLPESMRWLFWEVEFNDVDADQDVDYILARLLERGRLVDVRWAVKRYGLERIHTFFRDVGHPEISRRTIGFWRAVLDAQEEPWAQRPSWRSNNDAPWLD